MKGLVARTREPRLFQEEKDLSRSSLRQETTRERVKGDTEHDSVIGCHGLPLTVEYCPLGLTGSSSPQALPGEV